MVFDISGYEIFEELRFILELLIAEFLVALPLSKKKDHFLVRAIIGGAICLAYSMFYFVLKELLNSYSGNFRVFVITSSIIGHYCFLTLVTTLYLFFIFKTSFDQVLLYTIIGYSIQHIAYVLFTELVARTWVTNIINYLYLYVAFSIFGYVLLLILLYFIFINKFTNLDHISFGSKVNSNISYSVILIVTIFLTFAGQSIYQNSSSGRIVDNPNYLGAAVSLLTCGIILFCLYLLFVDNQKTKEKEMVNQLLYEQGKQYEMKKESVDSVKRLAHDMKHQILALKNEVDDKNEILSKMEDEVERYDSQINTGNEAVNVIIMDKMISTKNTGIRIEFDGDASVMSFMDTVDIYVFLGNAIDNAIEAINRSNIENKNITLSIKSTKGVTSIAVSNYYDGNIHLHNGHIKTRKKDNVLHGIGLKSMKQIVEKYNGTVELSTENKIFTLKALFFNINQ